MRKYLAWWSKCYLSRKKLSADMEFLWRKKKKVEQNSSFYFSSLWSTIRERRGVTFSLLTREYVTFSTERCLAFDKESEVLRGIGRQTAPFTHPAPSGEQKGEGGEAGISLAIFQRGKNIDVFPRYLSIVIHIPVSRRDFSARGIFYSRKVWNETAIYLL